jgi:hypothetical protein
MVNSNEDQSGYERSIGSELYQETLNLNLNKIMAMQKSIFKFRITGGQTEEQVFKDLVKFAEEAGIDDVSYLFATAMVMIDALLTGRVQTGKGPYEN